MGNVCFGENDAASLPNELHKLSNMKINTCPMGESMSTCLYLRVLIGRSIRPTRMTVVVKTLDTMFGLSEVFGIPCKSNSSVCPIYVDWTIFHYSTVQFTQEGRGLQQSFALNGTP